jgi:hypothetical protein
MKNFRVEPKKKSPREIAQPIERMRIATRALRKLRGISLSRAT